MRVENTEPPESAQNYADIAGDPYRQYYEEYDHRFVRGGADEISTEDTFSTQRGNMVCQPICMKLCVLLHCYDATI